MLFIVLVISMQQLNTIRSEHSCNPGSQEMELCISINCVRFCGCQLQRYALLPISDFAMNVAKSNACCY